jgi:hypothetical protein
MLSLQQAFKAVGELRFIQAPSPVPLQLAIELLGQPGQNEIHQLSTHAIAS